MAAKVRARVQQQKRVRARSTKSSALPAVYFLSLSLENVRCFGPKQTLRLSDAQGRPARWTVILGNNGMGKTTLLQALTTFEPEAHQEEGSTLYSVKGYGFDVQPHLEPIRNQASNYKVSATLTTGRLVDRASKTWPQQEASHWRGRSNLGNLSSLTVFSEQFSGLICYGYGATRRLGAGALSARKEFHPSDSLFLEDVPLRNAEEWLLQADYAAKSAHGRDTAGKKRDRIKKLLLDLLPEVEDLRFSPPDETRLTAQVEAKTHYGWVSMRGLSLGYRTLIAWMVDFASRLFERYPNSPNPLAEPAVVLVDEIDLHLHPQWQRTLIGHLTGQFPNTQFIVTAHSPLVVQSATDANIVVLRREGDHVVIDNDVESIRGWRVDQILTSDLFGLESARPPQLTPLLNERTTLLSKSRLTSKDKARLRELEAQIGSLPTGETPTEREALDLIQRAATHLSKGKK